MKLLGLAVGLLLSSTSVAAEDPLVSLLSKAGESERRKSDTACTFIEESVFEELSSDGKSEGEVFRSYETTVRNARVSARKLVSKKVKGDPSSLLQREQEENKDAQYSAFHPSQQSLYVFRLEGTAEAKQVKVRFTPRRKHEKRMQGTALIDRESGLVERIDGSLSDLPAMLDEFQLSMTQTETACGPQTTGVTMKGKGGLLFFTTRFRAKTVLKDHRKR